MITFFRNNRVTTYVWRVCRGVELNGRRHDKGRRHVCQVYI